MVKNIFVNLPVKDLKKTSAFYSALGFKFNPTFANKNGACMIIGKNMYSMLLVEKFFKGFTKKKVADAKRTTEVLLAIQLNSRKEVDSMVQKAVNAGGKIYSKPQDHGFTYQHGFADLDGHQWEPFWMDEKKMGKQ